MFREIQATMHVEHLPKCDPTLPVFQTTTTADALAALQFQRDLSPEEDLLVQEWEGDDGSMELWNAR